ncbi:uncharacterized protein [Rutidosis leptorrhynchoides]|uniref:uncharacterized protein n=1 Tax=Rutidosis leptorrhynchoides TaxID=125765 RepID=UPI003A998F12
MKKGKAKVKWDDVCLPKEEGGLGIKRLKYWNIALLTIHVWRILAHKKSLWVRWMHSYRLKDSNFWDVSIPINASWGWRNLLSKRDVLRGRFIHEIRNGSTTSAWFDEWTEIGPLINIVRRRDIVRSGLAITDSVRDVIVNNSWLWPDDWVDRFPTLANLLPPVLINGNDVVKWKQLDGNKCDFSINQHIDFPITSHNWKDFALLLSPFAARNVARIVVIKLLFAASVYFIWQERNRRIFKKGNRSPVQVYGMVYSTVRLKLMSFKWKVSPSAIL